jgi:hypothetical protein
MGFVMTLSSAALEIRLTLEAMSVRFGFTPLLLLAAAPIRLNAAISSVASRFTGLSSASKNNAQNRREKRPRKQSLALMSGIVPPPLHARGFATVDDAGVPPEVLRMSIDALNPSAPPPPHPPSASFDFISSSDSDNSIGYGVSVASDDSLFSSESSDRRRMQYEAKIKKGGRSRSRARRVSGGLGWLSGELRSGWSEMGS